MDTITTLRLLPCPFCGEQPKMFYGTGYVSAGCDNEGCKVNPSVDFENGDGAKEKVMRSWNTRSPLISS